MKRTIFSCFIILATAQGCSQSRTSTVTETIPDSTLPAGAKKTTSFSWGGTTHVTERVSTDKITQLPHGNYSDKNQLFVVSSNKQVTYKGSGTMAYIKGSGNVINLPGTWTYVSISGHDNVIRANAINGVFLDGDSNTVQWKKMGFKNNILARTGDGMNNTVVQVAE